MKRNLDVIFSFIALLTLSACSNQAGEPREITDTQHPAIGQDHNGGFAYANSSELLLDIAKTELANQLLYDNMALKASIAPDKPINEGQLIKVIQMTRKSYFQEMNRIDSDGRTRPLMFNYGVDADGMYIEALKLYFVGFLEEDISDENILKVKKRLLHEASHLFGYREENQEAFNFSARMMDFLGKRPKGAGYRAGISVVDDPDYRTVNPDGSVNFVRPMIREFEGADPAPISILSSPGGVCSLFGFRKAHASFSDNDGAGGKNVLVGQDAQISGYVFAADYLDPREEPAFSNTRDMWYITCSDPEPEKHNEFISDYATRPMRSFRDNSKTVTQLDDGPQLIEAPFVPGIEDFAFLLSEQSDPFGVCKHMGFEQYIPNTIQTKARSDWNFEAIAQVDHSGSIVSLSNPPLGSERVIESIQCSDFNPITAALQFAQRDKSRPYGGEESVYNVAHVLENKNEWKDFEKVLAYVQSQNPGLRVPQGPNYGGHYALVRIPYLDCESTNHYLAVQRMTGQVLHLFSLDIGEEDEVLGKSNR